MQNSLYSLLYLIMKYFSLILFLQVIIHAVDLPDIVHNTSNGPIHFGPVFDKDFLTQVLELQEDIMNLGRNSNDTVLEDICFAPLSSESTVKKDVSNCIVQSIWGYFGNDLERLNETDEDGNFEVSK